MRRSVSFVGTIKRVIIEWQDGELVVTEQQVVEHIHGTFLALGAAGGITRSPRGRQKRKQP